MKLVSWEFIVSKEAYFDDPPRVYYRSQRKTRWKYPSDSNPPPNEVSTKHHAFWLTRKICISGIWLSDFVWFLTAITFIWLKLLERVGLLQVVSLISWYSLVTKNKLGSLVSSFLFWRIIIRERYDSFFFRTYEGKIFARVVCSSQHQPECGLHGYFCSKV